MSYFKHIDNGQGPCKLFIGGLHGKESKTSIKLIKKLKKDDFSNGQIYIYNLDSSPYISTIDKRYYESETGKKVIGLIEKHKPDFYTELHSYNIQHFNRLTSISRFNTQGVPPLINCGDYVLISSVSPLIRMKYFSLETICKTLEIPCLHDKKKVDDAINNYGFNPEKSISRYMDLLKLISKSVDRKDFTQKITKNYPKQVDLAINYVKLIWGEDFPPF